MSRDQGSILDVSSAIYTGMTVYPGDPEVALDAVSVASAADLSSATVERLGTSTHAGTHVDAPAHVVPGGATVDEIPLELLCGPARVVDLEGRGAAITAETLRGLGLDDGVARLLLRTRGPALGPGRAFDLTHAHVTLDAAELLRRSTAVRLLGIDTPSIESPRSASLEVHRALLGADPPIVLVEGLELGGVAAGEYWLLCLPLRLRGAGGAPARVALAPRPARCASPEDGPR